MRHRPRSSPAPSGWSRRDFVSALAGTAVLGPGLAAALRPSRVRAAEDRVVLVPHAALGAMVAAVGGGHVSVTIDPALPPVTLRMGGTEVDLTDRVLLKGQGPTRRRYLDDARNAPKLGTAVRDHLRTRWPELGDAVAAQHEAWSHAMVRNVLRWTRALSGAGLRGKRVRDPAGRIYLLEWAGATVDSRGDEPPAGLDSAPRQPTAATPRAYDDYIQALVDALRPAARG